MQGGLVQSGTLAGSKLTKLKLELETRDFNTCFILQFVFGVPFKHLKLITTNRFGENITSLNMAGANQPTHLNSPFTNWLFESVYNIRFLTNSRHHV
jgi:hypothetical protein